MSKVRTRKQTINYNKPFLWTGALSPTALSGDVDDYGPSGYGDASVLRIDGGASNRNITGLAGGVDGRILVIHNVGTTNSLVCVQQSSSSVAANRFILANDGNLTIRLNGSAMFRYDGTSSRWRCIADHA